ncbi:MAG: Re/Si-specific NAD(P)(+) transhydrogenase subunit alpha [Planctomycetota bacterium]|jgi:NAD(P) transhydrogenase subunit alpha
MKIGVLKERAQGESRVSVIPETVQRVSKKAGVEFVVERGAGVRATFPDAEYEKAGATIVKSAFDADLVIKILEPTADEIGRLKRGSALLSLLFPLSNHGAVKMLADRGIDAIATDMIPRTSAAQSMDVLSSQSNLAGYKGVVMAAEALPRFFPMMMTAAGTIRPAKVLVLGAGVAGLQAIATAKRLGASVEAFDVRRVVKEQVESLGARFVMVDEKEDAAGEGGYAKEASEDYRKRQGELVHKHIAKSDVVVTTALIPGRPAPKLITEQMVIDMPKGSVIVDIAAPMGGNCELTEPGRTVVRHDVTIIGHTNLPSTMPHHASQLYSRNMEKLLLHLVADGKLKWDMEDEITQGCAIVKGGEVVHPKVKEAMP